MTMTVNSAAVAYCSAAQFVVVFDWRTFAQLASDTDTALANSAALQASPVLAAKLQIAAGQIEMAATIGQRYDPTDLTKLVTPDAITTLIVNSGWTLISMNAALAAWEMFGRRMEGMPEFVKEKVEIAKAQLAALEEGTAIFGFAEVQQAGIIQDYQETAQDVVARNLPSYVARRVFGRRDNRLPYGRNA